MGLGLWAKTRLDSHVRGITIWLKLGSAPLTMASLFSSDGGKVTSNSTRWEDWVKIDDEERRVGDQRGKIREKIFSVKDMLDIIKS